MPPDTKQYRVLCLRYDGGERLFNSYATLAEAEAIAAALNRVGCLVRLEQPAAARPSHSECRP